MVDDLDDEMPYSFPCGQGNKTFILLKNVNKLWLFMMFHIIFLIENCYSRKKEQKPFKLLQIYCSLHDSIISSLQDCQ